MQALLDLGPEWVDGVQSLLNSVWWAENRPRAEVASNLTSSAATAGIVDDDGVLVAFARALSDGLHRAVILDVVVAHPLRRHGIGRHVMRALLDHPKLRDVEAVALWCKPEHMAFYAEFGFSDNTRDMRLMIRGDLQRS